MASSSIPTTMKAIVQPDKHSLALEQQQVAVPTPSKPDEILVRVVATSPCAGELTWAANFPDMIPPDRVPIACQDLAGVVAVAPPNSAFKPGDEVYSRVPASRPGAGAEYVVAVESELALRPRSIDWVHTAATPLSALTAYQAVFTQGTLDAAALLEGSPEARERNAAKRVLVTGASGGVGGWVVQFAAAAGAGAVVAVAGRGKGEAVRGLGATEVVDYTQTSLPDWAAADPARREVDLVVDCVGGASLVGSWSVVKEGGALVSVTTPPDTVRPEAQAGKKLGRSLMFIVEPLGAQLAEIARLIDAGLVRPTVDSVWEFDDYAKAFARLHDGHAQGKIIIKVDESAA